MTRRNFVKTIGAGAVALAVPKPSLMSKSIQDPAFCIFSYLQNSKPKPSASLSSRLAPPENWIQNQKRQPNSFLTAFQSAPGLPALRFGMDQFLPVLQIFQGFTQLAEQGLSLRNLLIHIGIAPCARFASGSDGAHL
jgi:hypothetical protein